MQPIFIIMRDIKIVWKTDPQSTPTGGVYMIWFGPKYYIGRSRYLYERKNSHQSEIKKRLKADHVSNDQDYYKHAIAHLVANPKITTGQLDVLFYSDNDCELVAFEQALLDDHSGNKNCLNYGFEAKAYAHQRKETFVPTDALTNRQKGYEKAKATKAARYPPKPKPVIKHLTNKQKLAQLKRTLRQLDRDF